MLYSRRDGRSAVKARGGGWSSETTARRSCPQGKAEVEFLPQKHTHVLPEETAWGRLGVQGVLETVVNESMTQHQGLFQ